MKMFRVLAPGAALAAASLLFLGASGLHAQGLRPAPGQPLGPASAAGPAASPRPADFIVAVVNSEPITNNEVFRRAQRQLQQMDPQQARAAAPDMARLVLNRLIDEKVQLQQAYESGVRADTASIDQAEMNVALQNQLTLTELRRRVVLDGLTVPQFRAELRDQIMLARVREREVDARLKISDADVDQYLREQQTSTDPATLQINLAMLLVTVPDDASAATVAIAQAKAERALQRARAGEDFAALVRELSDGLDRATGGELGLRMAERYPPLFVQAIVDLPQGGVSGLLRSGAGFHVLKVLEKRNTALPSATVRQSRARHILLRPSPPLTEAAARERLAELKKRIGAGQADFAALAREQSQDASATQGGDLGWTNAGQFVPEFEEVLNNLAPGQISEPFVSRFGLHLLQLMERRDGALTEREQREIVRNMMRERKLDEAYANWSQEVRGKAYIEMREPPL